MNHKECFFPVRAYWDITPDPLSQAVDHKKICDEIVRNKILSLQLTDANFPLGRSVIEILETLKGENVAVSLAVSGELMDPSAIELLCRYNIRAIFFDVSSLAEIAAVVDKMRGYGGTVSGRASLQRRLLWGISFNVRRTNYRDLPDAMSICAKNAIPRFLVPMQRLTRGKECFYIDKEGRKELAGRVSGIKRDNGMVIIHDPFLWRIFFSSVQFPEGGCQAANSMFYLSPEGDVYPCPSLPLKLGSLKDASLEVIMRSSQKQKLRERLLMPPAACCDCNEVERCVGGCRGRAYASIGSFNVQDPACV